MYHSNVLSSRLSFYRLTYLYEICYYLNILPIYYIAWNISYKYLHWHVILCWSWFSRSMQLPQTLRFFAASLNVFHKSYSGEIFFRQLTRSYTKTLSWQHRFSGTRYPYPPVSCLDLVLSCVPTESFKSQPCYYCMPPPAKTHTHTQTQIFTESNTNRRTVCGANSRFLKLSSEKRKPKRRCILPARGQLALKLCQSRSRRL